MVNVKSSRVIDADPERIWNFIMQVERFPEWMPGVVSAKVENSSSRTASALGQRHTLKTKTGLGTGETTQEIISWEPPNKITWYHVRDVINGKEVKYSKEIRTTLSISNVDGRVTFRMVGSWQPAGISGRLMKRLLQRTVRKNFRQALANLEKLTQEDQVLAA